MSEVAGISGEGELALGVEPTMQWRATWLRGKYYNKWIFGGVEF
jgi:hypothetical protein